MMPAAFHHALRLRLAQPMFTLSYGADSKIELELENDGLVTVCDAPRGSALGDVAGEMRAVLAAPREFPPLKEAALPGDKVVLALDRGVPRAATIVAQTIDVLLSAGVLASDVTLLTTPGGTSPHDALAELRGATRAAVAGKTHDPRDRERLSYLAATEEANPIYIPRAIHDAALVVAIGSLRLPHTLGYHGIYSGIFPTFSDASTLARFRSPKAVRLDEQERLRKEADEVGWLLGSRFTIQVVPDAGDDVLHVLAGDQEAVLVAGGRLCDAAWSFEVPHRVELVVAAIGGDDAQQTWDNVGRALAAAARVLEENGDVVICSRLEQPPGPGMERIIGADDLHVALREIAREKPVDSLPASQLGEALQRGRVYMLSDLPEERIEELGMIPLDADSVPNVASRYGSCVVLANAQHAQAWPSGQFDAVKPRARKSRS